MKDTIQKLPTNKVVGPDRILNKVIKAALKAVVILLTNAVTTCLFKGNLLKCCKDIITVVL